MKFLKNISDRKMNKNNLKNIKKFIKLYDEKRSESFEKWGYLYPPKDWKEFEQWNEMTFEKHLKDATDAVIKTKLFISLLDETEYFGFLLAFENQDFKLLNDVIFQTSRQELLDRAMSASGTDHCNVVFNVLKALACNDFEVIDAFFPKNLPLAKGQFYTENVVNLLHILYYKQTDLQQETVTRAQKFLQKKITLWEKCVVEFLLAVLEKNAPKCSEILQELCSAYQKIGYPMEKIEKCFAVEIHGLYRLVNQVDKNLFEQIKMPIHDSFFIDFELWHKENNYPKGELFYIYPPKMEYMNQILKAKLPKMTLYAPYSDKRIYKNVEKFAKDLTEIISINN